MGNLFCLCFFLLVWLGLFFCLFIICLFLVLFFEKEKKKRHVIKSRFCFVVCGVVGDPRTVCFCICFFLV